MHSVKVTLIADQEVSLLGRPVNIHDVVSVRLNADGAIVDVATEDGWLGKRQWQREWPTDESGMWWFYGWTYKKLRSGDKLEEPRLYLVRMRKLKDSRMMYVTDGHFLYKAEGAEGMWLKAELPATPEEVKPR